MKVVAFTALITVAAVIGIVRGQDDHDHDHDHGDHSGHKCACEALEFGFDINCKDTDQMLSALPILQQENCNVDCSSDVCVKNFLIVQSHHDYCFHEDVPESVEDALHLYEDTCEACWITPLKDPDLPDCPDVDCTSEAGNEAYQALVTGGCETNCTTSSCANNFRTLKAFHDGCPGDSIDPIAEQAFHDLDSACDGFQCNIVGAGESSDALVCNTSDAHIMITSNGMLALALVSAAFLLAY